MAKLQAEVRRAARAHDAHDRLPRDDHGAAPKGRGGTRSSRAAAASSATAGCASRPLPRGEGYPVRRPDRRRRRSRASSSRRSTKGIQEAAARGVLAGFPLVDFQVELFDGSYHSVDSNEMSFKMAGILAFKTVAPKCRPVLLEPLDEVEIVTPDDYLGDVLGDLSVAPRRTSSARSRRATCAARACAPSCRSRSCTCTRARCSR